jgi:hypothetical protein
MGRAAAAAAVATFAPLVMTRAVSSVSAQLISSFLSSFTLFLVSVPF